MLEQAFLIAAISKFSPRPTRQRSSPPKLIALNNGLLSAVLDVEPASRGCISTAQSPQTGDFVMRDLAGLLEFCRRHPKFEPLVLCSRKRAAEKLGGVKMLLYWGDFLLGQGPSEA